MHKGNSCPVFEHELPYCMFQAVFQWFINTLLIVPNKNKEIRGKKK